MAHEVALSMVNDLKMQLSRLARQCADATKDGKVEPLEGIMLAQAGMQIATALIAMMSNRDAAIRDDVLFILEHGHIVFDDMLVAAPVAMPEPVVVQVPDKPSMVTAHAAETVAGKDDADKQRSTSAMQHLRGRN
jgi:hypothetical protein